MDEDLDQMVERLAALLLSDKLGEVGKGSAELRALSSSPGSAQVERFSRLLQELAAYHGGAVLDHLLAGAHLAHAHHIRAKDAILQPEINHYNACCSGVCILTCSRVVIDRCLQLEKGVGDAEKARELYANFSGAAEAWARKLERGQDHLNPLAKIFVITPLDCVTNFALSAVFRDEMRRASEARSLSQQLGFFLSPQFLKLVSEDTAFHIRNVLSILLTLLAGSTDSQVWALDKGLLKILAALYECSPSPYSRDPVRLTEAPAFRCNLALLDLLRTEATVGKLRAHNALDGFRPHRRKINNAAEPGSDLWGYFEAKLQGRQEAPLLDVHFGQYVMSGTGPSVRFPVVCSWKECKRGAEPAGTKFGKCGHCHVARYCRNGE